MTAISKYISSNWDLISPFERAERKTIDDLRDGEKKNDVCKDLTHTVEWDGEPPLIVKLNATELQQLQSNPIQFRSENRELYRDKCFLWVITETSLIIAREKIRNIERTHDPDYICHTNLTSATQAYIAGEILFGEDGSIYINNFSDRYGGKKTPKELWEATKVVFNEMGYTKCIDILELI